MAENLSVPADYTKAKVKVSDMNLLPPSAFKVKSRQTDPWKEIARTTEEVTKLKLENKQLKEAQKYTAEKVTYQETLCRPLPEVCKYPSSKDDLKYVDELINKQACEIADLKNELRVLKCQQREEITEIERQLTLKEREYTHRIASLEADLKAEENRYEVQVDRLSHEHQRETDELNDAVEKLQSELTNVRVRSGERIEEVESKFAQLQATSRERIDHLTHELRSKEDIIENQTKQLAQLKKYIGETENLPKPADIVRKEKESLAVKVKNYESESENMNSTIQLLNIRLNSMNEILKLQETELSKSLDIEKSKGEGLLLTRWREKVFALMVQQKSSDITWKKDETNWKAKVGEMERRLSSARNQIDQLTHTLSDREAELNMERNVAMRLQGELSEAQQLALCLDDRIQENVGNSRCLQDLASSVWAKFQENSDTVNTALSTLKAYGQRISFASGRVEMLQGQFARREAMLKMQIENQVPEKETVCQNPDLQIPDSEEESYLRSELVRVTRERDSLSTQIKEDSLAWDKKVASIRKQVEDELNELREAKGDLEGLVQEKIKTCAELSEKLETTQGDLDYANQTIEELKETLAKQEVSLEQLVTEQRQEIENQSADRLAELDRQLNDAKREQAKAVVSLRQLERQSAREKERSAEHLATVEEHYSRQIEKLTEQLKSVEKERNLMMATLRQEGLIGRVKTERGEPVTLSWDTEDGEPIRDTQEPTSTREALVSEIEPENLTEEPLTSVLEDLQSLTTAVLEDNNSDTGSDSEA